MIFRNFCRVLLLIRGLAYTIHQSLAFYNNNNNNNNNSISLYMVIKVRSANVKKPKAIDMRKLIKLPRIEISNMYNLYILQEMINRYSAALNVSGEEITEALEQLRVHAVTKLQIEQRFAKSGIATIKVHLTGSIPQGINNRFQIQTGLHKNGTDFKRRYFFFPLFLENKIYVILHY